MVIDIEIARLMVNIISSYGRCLAIMSTIGWAGFEILGSIVVRESVEVIN